jgi:uncharacterized membrane protein YfbV (UPF0208 family)
MLYYYILKNIFYSLGIWSVHPSLNFIFPKSRVVKVFGKKNPWVLALTHIDMVFLQIQIAKGRGPLVDTKV